MIERKTQRLTISLSIAVRVTVHHIGKSLILGWAENAIVAWIQDVFAVICVDVISKLLLILHVIESFLLATLSLKLFTCFLEKAFIGVFFHVFFLQEL